MEQVRTARRSASHGSLNRSYAVDVCYRPRVGPSRTFSRPLRSVNENASLLASPGPLESMLKTTTETGDIGLFSIKPVRPPATFHGPHRARPIWSDTSLGGATVSDGFDTFSLRDDRRRLPSYRDTASEIISMYASDSQRSVSSSLSPPFDELGQRSYSMTTCSSRLLPHQKSSGTMESQSSGGLLQRPRSPFPYPTRLKRPGVRPSSPAVTENGGVDYSRMVEIDRISRRTVHGSYKPTYPQRGRRPAPGLARLGHNRSGLSSSNCDAVYGSQYPHSFPASAPAAWGGRFRSRLDSGTSEHSLRTASLTSIVDMYQPTSCAPRAPRNYPRPQPSGSFYYDYSEDFDSISESPPVLVGPLAPVPTRAASMRRPRVLEDGCDVRFHGPTAHRFPVLHEISTTGEQCCHLPNSEDKGDLEELFCGSCSRYDGPGQPFLGSTTQLGSLELPDYEANEAVVIAQHPSLQQDRAPESCAGGRVGSDSPTTSTDEKAGADSSSCHEVETKVLGKTVVRIEQTVVLRGEETEASTPTDSPNLVDYETYRNNARKLAASSPGVSSQTVDIYRSLPLSWAKKESVSSTSSGHRRRSKYYSIEPGLSDLASLVQHLERAANTTSQDDSATPHSPVNSPMQASPDASSDDPAREESFQGPQIKDGTEDNDDNLAPAMSRPQTPILAPHPISPVRELRLQNSVPQLMKALPPLPGSSTRSESYILRMPFDRLDLPARFSPLDLSKIWTPQSMLTEPSVTNRARDDRNRVYRKPDVNEGDVKADSESNTEKRIPTPGAPSPTASNSSSGQDTSQPDRDEASSQTAISDGGEDHKATKPRNGKLKLKVSRGALAKSQMEAGGIRRTTIPEQIGGWREASAGPRRLVTRGDCSTSSMIKLSENVSICHMEDFETCEHENAFIGSSAPSPPAAALSFCETGGHLDDYIVAAQESVVLVNQVSPVEVRSSFSDESAASGRPPRGLRKRLSDLRVRLAESRLRIAEEPMPETVTSKEMEHVGIGFAVLPTASLVDGNKIQLPSRIPARLDDGLPLHHRGFRGRMSKWMKTARQAIMAACTGLRKRG
ncbi:hypothetical protein B0T26DRAFT_22300 [Lasiosphaeria miniovina]|uniref:Uncharacterized protein n=1 Tax=Lasiosphaeria miniovina TaxID=1954250 RepID=A0AA40BFU4_9PEZI|nr:uncharacterized protein B0T26DRAFT_22300 [Lasiosphaeria miniovina]KAK0733471.1 hypothetical protein B0T26DRAFT_22300 [Lasiosphaeria miniovina]